ncbi:MAG: substrate-binding periplasmic protein [Aeromonadaceae bacterium]
MKTVWFAIWLSLLWHGGVWAASPIRLTIYADSYPPFILHDGGKLSGPFIDAFTQLAAEHGIGVQYQPVPAKRVMKRIASQADSCGLAVNFSPGEAEVVRYVARVAPITLAVYARQGEVGQLHNIEALRNYRVGAIDVAELNQLLDNAAIRYEPLAKSGSGIAMLQVGRFDLLVSDVLPELVEHDKSGPKIERVMVLARVERWLACNSHLSATALGALRQAMQDGLFADSVAPIWQRHRLTAFYDEVRSEWRDPP